MPDHSLSHVSDRDLTRDLASLVEQERAQAEALKAYIAEADARGLELPASVALAREDLESSEQRFRLELTLDQDTYERLLYAQALAREAGLPDDVEAVIQRAVKMAITEITGR